MTCGESLGVVVNAAGVEGIGMRAVVESGAWYIGWCIGGGRLGATRGWLGGAGGVDECEPATRIDAKLITASGF